MKRSARGAGSALVVLVALLALSGCKSSPTVGSDAVDDADDDDDDDDDDGSPFPDGGFGTDDAVIDDDADDDSGDGECVPATCDTLGADCGAASDGCGGIVDCGQCDDDERCGIVELNVCTSLAELCIPAAQGDACDGRQCGLVGDGCGGALDCGTCGDGEACGVEERFQCGSTFGVDDGGSGACKPLSADEACEGKVCGIVFDGCGAEDENTYDCAEINGGCELGEYCGLLEAFECDEWVPPECTGAASCEELGWECGMAIDECGNVIDCADEGLSCNGATETCIGGIDEPATCRSGTSGGGDDDCELCGAIADCSGETQETTLTGRVVTPGKSDDDTGNQVGVPNAFVYILRTSDPDDLPNIETGIPIGGSSCDRCEDQELGPVLTSDTTNSLGEFELSARVPVGEEFLLVVKIGKFRRAVTMTLDEDDACHTIALPLASTRLPRAKDDGIGAHLPKIAISTGQIDAMECVFYKMGIADDEFAQPGDDASAPARVHMYRANGGVLESGSTPHTQLHATEERLFSYDMVVFDCEGAGFGDYDPSDERVRHYVNSGGRMFASHLSFTWISDNGDLPYAEETAVDTGLAASANFTGAAGGGDRNGVGMVSVGRPQANPAKIEAFAEWLVNEGVTAEADGQYPFDILDPRELSSSVNEFSEEFVYRERGDETWVQQYSFNTPYGSPEEALCGRVAYSGFHVSAGSSGSAFRDALFPGYCAGSLSNQEKVLLFMLFDLGACVTTDVPNPPHCEPVGDCTGRCGAIPDGCGGTLDCSCPSGLLCLPGGLCGDTDCTPTTCDAQGAECGIIADGCAGALDCGPCPAGQICGVERANKCAEPPDCPPLDCDAQGAECGVVGDGCGGKVDCGPCPAGEVCGLVKAFQCDPPTCTPLTCEEEHAECGLIGDGCGDLADCGVCRPGYVCGLFSPNKCGKVPANTK